MPIIFKYSDVINAVFKGLQNLGGSGSNIEIKNQVIQILNCTQAEVDNVLGDGQNELDVKLTDELSDLIKETEEILKICVIKSSK